MATVFISHRRTDTAPAERLSQAIRDAGHQVWLDEWNIGLGDSIVQRMNEGLTGAAYVVVCYSASGITSPWMSREWMSALSQQLEGKGVKLLPVLLTGPGEIPALLSDIKYADLVRDWDRGVAQVLRAMR
jgi:TIR domain